MSALALLSQEQKTHHMVPDRCLLKEGVRKWICVEYVKEQMLNLRMLPQQCVGQTLRKVHSPITGVLTEIAFTIF